jgi:beta-mannosidase
MSRREEKGTMKRAYDLGALDWTLAGWTPYVWRQQRSIESGMSLNAEVPAAPACVPGSVQGALRDAGIIPDWNVGLESRAAEWVENRHWVYTARIPDSWCDGGSSVRLRALGLDYSGWVLVNGQEAGSFRGSFTPHTFNLTPLIRSGDNRLQIVFDTPPRWLGQIGYTSEMRDWKERFNYFWDWTARLVQIGIWDDMWLEVSDGTEITAADIRTGADAARSVGRLQFSADASGSASYFRLSLSGPAGLVREARVSVEEPMAGVTWDDLPVELWWPNGSGDQALYTLSVELLSESGTIEDSREYRVGFAEVQWSPCEGAPPEADPWVCVVNGRPVFLQGVNWTPILPNFADASDEDYRRLLATYRDLGVNLLRVWGGAFLEKEVFYSLCDEMGIMVWQEFPLSSSGLDNRPPDDRDAADDMAVIARSYIERRRHHVSLVVWCGGNELQDDEYRPLDTSHPMLARLAQVVAEMDPGRRFLPTSPSGPRFGADRERFGQGEHWDVHGPWHVHGDLETEYRDFWAENDALFHSEIGAAGASPAEIIRAYKGDLPETPGTKENPLWRRTSWWVEWPVFVEEHGREPADLDEYVSWSQERQRRALGIAARSAKSRFPRCGGFLVWMGHDSFPCTANTSIIDFHGNLKPAAEELRRVYRETAAELEGVNV